MKFKKYLNESNDTEITSVDEFNDLIQSKCKPYLKLIKQFNKPFRRGMKLTYDLGWKSVRKDRRPRGTSKQVFPELNKWLVKNGHNDRSKSFSVSSGFIEMFGTNYYIFPIGDFSYTWMDSEDMNMDDLSTGWDRDNLRFYDFDTNTFKRDYHSTSKKPFKDYFHTDKDIDIAFKKGYEVWFNASRYAFVIDSDYFWNKSKQIIGKYNAI